MCLTVAEQPEDLKGLRWKVNSTVIVDDKNISPKYKEKVDYNPVNHTLCIKNLTDTDSGNYIANAKKNDWTDSTSSYKLKVLGEFCDLLCFGSLLCVSALFQIANLLFFVSSPVIHVKCIFLNCVGCCRSCSHSSHAGDILQLKYRTL